MSQIQVRANLLATDFALVTKFQGRTILAGQYDQKSTPSDANNLAGKDNDAQPEAYYMHNVLPTINGYKSVAYKEVVGALPPGKIFTRIVGFRDSDAPPEQDRGYLGITADGKTYMVSTLNGYWIDITPVGQPIVNGLGTVSITTATVLGITYVCYSGFGIFTINMHTRTMVPVTLLGITVSTIIGIAASNNYLLLHNGAVVFWSSAINPLDFVPSLITGAGSGTPASTGGPIVLLSPLSTGFAVYTTTNIVLASFSGNTRYPWIFKEANNSSGIASVTSVASAGDDGSNYAWTSAGLLKVTLAGAVPVLPEVTDFLSGQVIEDFDPITKTFNTTYLPDKLSIQLSYSSSRYVIVSYGRADAQMSYSLVYDLALKRIGKLKLNHAAPIEFVMDYAGNGITYAGSVTTYPFQTFALAAGSNITIGGAKVLSSTPASAKHTMAFMAANGAINIVTEDYADYTADAVLLLGKYQLIRNNLISVQGVIVETIDAENPNFNIGVLTSYDGNYTAPYVPLVQHAGGAVREYLCRVTGVNHSFLIEGAFNLVSFMINFSKHGRA